MTPTAAYLVIWFYAFIGALAVAFLSHLAHAHFQPYPDKLFDGDGISDKILNELMSPEYTVLGEYDSGGWWDSSSVRNYLIHAVPLVLIVLFTGLLHWENREDVMAAGCRQADSIGWHPRLCP